jgi:hypothetical protein
MLPISKEVAREIMRPAELAPFDPFTQTRAEYEELKEIERLKGCFSNLKEWRAIRNELQDKRDRLLAGIDRMRHHVQNAGQAQAAIAEEKKNSVQRMLANFGLAREAPPDTGVDVQTLQARADAETRAAETAEAAILEANTQLCAVNRQIAAIDVEFGRVMNPELEHLATRLSGDYMRALGALK